MSTASSNSRLWRGRPGLFDESAGLVDGYGVGPFVAKPAAPGVPALHRMMDQYLCPVWDPWLREGSEQGQLRSFRAESVPPLYQVARALDGEPFQSRQPLHDR